MNMLNVAAFRTEGGHTFVDAPVAWRAYGTLNKGGTNAIVVCHALTGNTDLDAWWGPMVGPGRVLDTDRYFVVSMNVIGSPYGSLSPLTARAEGERIWGPDFPDITIRDTVAMHRRALEQLGVREVQLAIGASMGGMQALEWAFHTDLVRAVMPIATGARHSAWSVGWGEAQRQAIRADRHWNGGWYSPDRPPVDGLSSARMMAMLSYRSAPSFETRFGRQQMPDGPMAVESYLRYQGRKLVDRFDANCYVALTRQMDTHDVGRGRGGTCEALSAIRQPVLVIGIDSDVLYPFAEQEELARCLPRATLAKVRSPHGHDAFLMEYEQLEAVIAPWMSNNVSQAVH